MTVRWFGLCRLLVAAMMAAVALSGCGSDSDPVGSDENTSDVDAVFGDVYQDVPEGDADSTVVRDDFNDSDVSSEIDAQPDAESDVPFDSETESDGVSDVGSDSDVEVEDPGCASLSVTELGFGAVLKGEKVTRTVTLCNTCSQPLSVYNTESFTLSGTCNGLGVSQLQNNGQPIDLTDDAGLLLRLGAIQINQGECLSADVYFDTADVAGGTALDCHLTLTLTDGHTYAGTVTGNAADFDTTLSEADCLAIEGTCFVDGVCYVNGAQDRAGLCAVCDSGTTRLVWSKAPRGLACQDGSMSTWGDRCDAAGNCLAGWTYACEPTDCATARTTDGSGRCEVVTAAADGIECTDPERHVANGTCVAGVCVPGTCDDDGVMTAAQPDRCAPRVSKLFSDYRHSCMLLAEGELRCWGHDEYGQVGDGQNRSPAFFPTPVLGLPAERIIDAGVGYGHSCALTSSGKVFCWGRNSYGQLGDASNMDSMSAVQVTGLDSGSIGGEVYEIAVGYSHSCALTTEGAIYCWGRNDRGQLGDNGTASSSTPVPVELPDGVVPVAVDLGLNSSCLLDAAGAVYCWGDGTQGQLGDGTFTYHSVPTILPDASAAVTDLAVSGLNACLRTDAGVTKCWGDNTFGQVGDGGLVDVFAPVVISGLTETTQDNQPGAYHSCFLSASGAVMCVGQNNAGQLGNGTRTDSVTFVTVNGLASVPAALSVGAYYTCALLPDGSVQCWGYNEEGALGVGPSTHLSTTPMTMLW